MYSFSLGLGFVGAASASVATIFGTSCTSTLAAPVAFHQHRYTYATRPRRVSHILYESPSPHYAISDVLLKLRTASSEGFGTRARNVASTMSTGDVVVPLVGDLEKRQSLAGKGVYAGVEYQICEIKDNNEGELQSNPMNRVATMKPAYPLRSHLERSDWPITINISEVPLWLSKTTYEAGTLLGTLFLAGSYLVAASIAATVLRIVVVPSESMEPALMPGDVVIVTRSILPPRVGDVVFFNPPSELDEAIANSKVGRAAADEKVPLVSTKGKQFIKRLVAVPGEKVGVFNSSPYVVICSRQSVDGESDCKYQIHKTGEYSRPDVFDYACWNRVTPTINTNINADETSAVLDKGEYFVAGDNGYRSVDSRVWGPLKRKYIFGTAQYIVFPPAHIGRIPDGNMFESSELK